MAKKDVTKIDPRKELSPYLNHQSNIQKKQKKRKKKSKLSASLSGLRAERRRSLFTRLGLIIGTSLIAIIILGYYVSPLANISSIQVIGANDLPTKQLVATTKINSGDKVIDYRFHSKNLDKRLNKKYPEVKNVKIKINHVNHLILNVVEYPTVGYIKDGDRYRKILANNKIGSQALTWAKVEQTKPLFVGYNKDLSLNTYLKLFNSFPQDFRDQVKLLSGSTKRKSQIILVMKDGNVVIGDIATLKDKIKYYDLIKKKAQKNSLIDLEIGAYSRPLTTEEKKNYGIS